MRNLLTILIASVIVLISISCADNETHRFLVSVDSLLERGKADIALIELSKIDSSKINERKDLIYFKFLMLEARFKLYKPVESDSTLEMCIEYYSRIREVRKLARSFYYKSLFLGNKANIEKAIVYAKQAENIVEENDIALKHHIYEILAYYNNDYSLSLNYAKKALYYGELAGNADWQIYAMNLMAASFDSMGEQDSTNYYLSKCLPLLQYANAENLEYYLSNIAIMFIRIKPHKAKVYVDRILKENPSPYTYAITGDMYYTLGDKNKAEYYFRKAMTTENASLKMEILKALAKIYNDNGEFEKVNILLEQVIDINNSINKARQKENIELIQDDFQRQSEFSEKIKTKSNIIVITLIISLVLTIIGLYCWLLASSRRLQLVNSRLEIIGCESKIKKLLQTNNAVRQEKQSEIKRLEKRLCYLKESSNAILTNGLKRFEEIYVNNGTTVKWSNKDITDFIEYSRLTDNDYITESIDGKNKLTNRNKLFLLLEHHWHDDEKLAHALNVEKDSIRVMRKRIKERSAVVTP